MTSPASAGARSVGSAARPTHGPPTTRRRRRGRSRFALLAVVLGVMLLAWSGVAFLNTIVFTFDIVVAPKVNAAPPDGAGSLLPAGQRLEVVGTPPTAALTVHNGKPHVDTGRQLFRVQVDPDKSHQVGAVFAWLNPPSLTGALRNGFVEIALYYQVPWLECDSNLGDVTIEAGAVTFNELGPAGLDGGNLCFRPATNLDLVTQFVAAATLQPNGQAVNRHYLYAIASILNAGSNAPPGQQEDLGEFRFMLKAY